MTKAVKITLIIAVSLVFIIGFLCLAWIYSPTEFVMIFKFEVENETLNTINNLTEVLGEEPFLLFNQTELMEVLG